MTDRIPCLVPGCRRTAPLARYGPDAEIICGNHWRRVPAFEKRHLAKVRRLYRRRPSESIGELCDRAWNSCKAEALAAAAGDITDSSLNSFVEML